MTDNETFIVQSAITDRLYVKTYHDFLDSTIIGGKEKLIFILLKRYLNFSDDKSGVAGTVYPTLDTLSKQSGMTKKTVIGILKKLESKGLIVVKQQGLNRPNIYTIRDFSGIWKAGTDKEVKEAIELYEEEYEDSKIIERLKKKGYKIIKEKELESEPTKAQTQALLNNQSLNLYNYITDNAKSQDLERYSIEQIKEYFDYNIMVHDNPYKQKSIDMVMNILYDTLNTSKKSIRVSGEDKPAMVVQSKLMKLDMECIMYAIDKYSENTERVKNPVAYMLTILYKAQEQYDLDIQNQVSHDMANWNISTDDDE